MAFQSASSWFQQWSSFCPRLLSPKNMLEKEGGNGRMASPGQTHKWKHIACKTSSLCLSQTSQPNAFIVSMVSLLCLFIFSYICSCVHGHRTPCPTLGSRTEWELWVSGSIPRVLLLLPPFPSRAVIFILSIYSTPHKPCLWGLNAGCLIYLFYPLLLLNVGEGTFGCQNKRRTRKKPHGRLILR